jgi:hypothetical protein
MGRRNQRYTEEPPLDRLIAPEAAGEEPIEKATQNTFATATPPTHDELTQAVASVTAEDCAAAWTKNMLEADGKSFPLVCLRYEGDETFTTFWVQHEDRWVSVAARKGELTELMPAAIADKLLTSGKGFTKWAEVQDGRETAAASPATSAPGLESTGS